VSGFIPHCFAVLSSHERGNLFESVRIGIIVVWCDVGEIAFLARVFLPLHVKECTPVLRRAVISISFLCIRHHNQFSYFDINVIPVLVFLTFFDWRIVSTCVYLCLLVLEVVFPRFSLVFEHACH